MRTTHAARNATLLRAVLLAALPVALLAGCNLSRDLTAKDSSAITYNARAVARVSGSAGGSGIELDFASVRGSGAESIGTAETVTLGGRSVTGPVELRNDVRVQNAHVAFNYLHFPARPVELEWFAGLGGVSVNWAAVPIASVQPRLSNQVEWVGATGGVGARWKIAPWVSLDGRVSLNYSVADVIGSKYTGEVAFAFKPVPQVALRLGYGWSTTYVEQQDIDSRLTFKARGPYLGLGLAF